jgi:hypothetical protein
VNTYAVQGSGITYAVDNLPAQGLRLQIDNAGVQYCAVLKASSGTIGWSQFNSKCWDGTGVGLTGAPQAATLVNFGVPAGSASVPFQFCVTALSFAP